MPAITPDEVGESLPEWVLKAWNEVIKDKWDGKRAIISYSDVKDKLALDKVPVYYYLGKRIDLIKPLYEKVGWDVEKRVTDLPASCFIEYIYIFTKKGE
jgi:hypothetical protein